MTTATRRWRLAGLILVAAVLGFGCQPLLLPYFLMGCPDAMKEPTCGMSLAPSDKDKKAGKEETKVVIVSHSALDLRPEFAGIDRDLCRNLADQLKHGFAHNKEKVTIVPVSQVDAYKDRHPEWRSQELTEIGEHFKADYVIYLEMQTLSLYEKGSCNTLYHGRADLHLALYDVHNTEANPVYTAEPIYEYPGSRGPKPVDEINPQAFRLEFLTYMAKRLAWHFTAHPAQDDISCDQ